MHATTAKLQKINERVSLAFSKHTVQLHKTHEIYSRLEKMGDSTLL